MTKYQICALIAFSFAVFFFGNVELLRAQALAAFGPAPKPAIYQQVRPVTETEVKSIMRTRVCNRSIPLLGGGEMKDADEKQLRQSAARYAAWEQEYQTQTILNMGQRSQPVRPHVDVGQAEYFTERRNGVPASLIDIFTRTFLVRTLYATGKDEEAVAEAVKLITQYDLRPAVHQVDQAEKEGTYLSKDALSNAVYFFSTLSKQRLHLTKQEEFKLLMGYLQMRDDILPTISLFNSEDQDEMLLSRAGALGIEAAKGTLGDELKQMVAAAWLSPETNDKAYIVLQGKPAVTLELDIDGGGMSPPPPPPTNSAGFSGAPRKGRPHHNQRPQTASTDAGRNNGDGGFQGLEADDVLSATVLVADKARDSYRRFLERQLSRYSSKEMILYDFQKDDDGALITVANPPNATPVPGGELPINVHTIRITTEQLNQVMSEPSASNADLIRQVLPASKDTALVAYTNPFAMRTSTYKELVNSFAFQLQRTSADWPAPGSADTELGVLMEPEVSHGETEVYTRVQA